MPRYEVFESHRFIKDVEESAVWILLSNIDESESQAEKKLNEFRDSINSLKERLQDYPESGEPSNIPGLRRFPVYQGRYSILWAVSHIAKSVTLITLSDSKYPKKLRQFQFDE